MFGGVECCECFAVTGQQGAQTGPTAEIISPWVFPWAPCSGFSRLNQRWSAGN